MAHNLGIVARLSEAPSGWSLAQLPVAADPLGQYSGARFLVVEGLKPFLAAHFPTERALLQTADIARRLMRGGELHCEAQAVG
jgi:hypothetical protein